MKTSIAFEIPAKDEEQPAGESIIQSHPPKRFRRLEDDQNDKSRQEIEQRQAEAERRRKEVRSTHHLCRTFKNRIIYVFLIGINNNLFPYKLIHF